MLCFMLHYIYVLLPKQLDMTFEKRQIFVKVPEFWFPFAIRSIAVVEHFDTVVFDECIPKTLPALLTICD